MAQHDYDIANQDGAATRADINAALAAIVSQNSGATEPAQTFPYMFWADTTAGKLKQRNAADSAWITVLDLTSGLNLNLISQAEAEAGIATTARSWTAQRVAQAIAALGAASKIVPVRQTVLSGPVDSNGLPAFGGSTGSTTVTATGTLRVTAANGFGASGQVDRVGSISNPSWTELSTNGQMYMYLDIASDGSCTPVVSTLQPMYRWGGADVTTNGQFTFNIQEMVGKVGNGSAAVQTYRVCVGEVTVAGGVVTAIVWYALMGRYRSSTTATLPAAATATNLNHNLGTTEIQGNVRMYALCTTLDGSYAVGTIIVPNATSSAGSLSKNYLNIASRNSLFIQSGGSSTGWSYQTTTGGTAQDLTRASWSYYVIVQRGW